MYGARCYGKDKDSSHLLAYENGGLVAYCRILPEGVSYEGFCSIGRIVSEKRVRGKGYGRALVNKAIEICDERFDFPIKISAQSYLENFYKEIGFEITGSPYVVSGIPHCVMVRPKG